ncbi:MAG: hypothetical protein WCX81_03600, partial [Monoglobales bacterium]
QMFFVNNRPVVSKMIANAVEEACKGMIPNGMYPMAIIKLNIPATEVDINVHPAKLEVKFSDEGRIYRAVYHAIKNAFATPEMPKIDVEIAEEVVSFSAYKPESSQEMTLRQNPMGYQTTPFVPQTKMTEFVPVYKKAEKPVEVSQKPMAEQTKIDNPQEKDYKIVGQIFDTYILVERGDEMLMVDQHAAHEHITYGSLKKQYDEGEISSQQLLVPKTVVLSPVEKAIASENIDILAEVGFECEDFGGNSIIVRGVPEALDTGKIDVTLTEILTLIGSHKTDITTEKKLKMLETVSCRGSIKAGKRLTLPEMDNLVRRLFEAEKTVNCPHGRPAIVSLTKNFVEKQFCRVK